MHIDGGERLYEGYVRDAAQDAARGLAHDGAQVDGVDDEHVGVIAGYAAHGGENLLHGLAVVLAPVAGEGDDAPPGEVHRVELGRLEALAVRGVRERVYDRVAGDIDAAFYVLAREVRGVVRRGGEVQRGEAADELAVHLLGIGAHAVVGAEPGLDVAAVYLRVEGGERGGEGRRGVAVDEHQVGLRALEDAREPVKHARGDVREGLAALHDVEVVVGAYVEDAEDAVEHLAVLRGDADRALNPSAALELQHQRGHLYGLRAGAEYAHDLELSHAAPPWAHGGGYCAPPPRRRAWGRRAGDSGGP